MRNIRSDIVIVGAGLIGSALALWLAKYTNFSISLVERNEPLSQPRDGNQRVVALGALATDFLQDVGVFATLGEHHCYPYQKMFVWDESSDGELCFDAGNTGHASLGHMIDSQECTYQLQQTVINSRVDCHFGAQANALDFHQTGAKLELDSGCFDAKLVIAADGNRSWVRQQAKVFANRHGYNQRGIVTKIETQKPHLECAWQCFLSTGPIGILPLSNNQSSIVWSADNVLAERLLGLSDQEFSLELSRALQGRLGSVKLLSERLDFPLASVRAERYYKRGLALVGDAAHSIHPLAGQGANLGFKDARVLGELLATANQNELGCPRLLSVYERKRQPDNNQTDSLMSALHQAYKFDLPIWMLARGLGMNLINTSDVLRNALARQAMGL